MFWGEKAQGKAADGNRPQHSWEQLVHFRGALSLGLGLGGCPCLSETGISHSRCGHVRFGGVERLVFAGEV